MGRSLLRLLTVAHLFGSFVPGNCCLASSRDPRRLTSNKIVRTGKNLLVREKISLLESVMGEKAKFGGSCNQTLFDKLLSPIYASGAAGEGNESGNDLTVFERSDKLYMVIRAVEGDMKGNPKSRMRRDLCMSSHLMICKNGKCECPNGGDYKEYKMTPTADGAEVECRVAEGGKCNPDSLLFCHANLLCSPDDGPEDANPSEPLPYSCTCSTWDPSIEAHTLDADSSVYAAPPLSKQLKFNVTITPLPSLTFCQKQIRYRTRPRGYQ